MSSKIRLGISTCLLGENVRYDGGHKLDRYLVHTLGNFVEYVPVCPEFEAGFGVPRESFRLVGDADRPKLMTTRTKVDHTERMLRWARSRVRELETENLHGFIFKSNSPSSGLHRVKVYNKSGMPEKKGRGLFARAFTDHFPLIPVEDDGRLHDPGIRENFIERIFAFKDWRDAVAAGRTRGNLVKFHSRYKLLLLAHSEKLARGMGRLVAESKKHKPSELFDLYQKHFLEALSLRSTLKKNINVLQHIMGFFKKELTSDEKQEILELVGRYRKGYVPLVVPITLLNHFARKYGPSYLQEQVYLQPHPVELALRNHV
jgi:uncharacterized protein YbgA (DUF1722 family)/uncharacterized protein YbbK (DUF523 family)